MGRPEFETIVAQVPREKIVITSMNIDFTQNPAPIGSEIDIDIYAEINAIGEIETMYMNVPLVQGASSGTHRVFFKNTTNGKVEYMLLRSTYDSDVTYNNSMATNANDLVQPSDQSAQYQIMRNMKFDNITGLRVGYVNNTDVENNHNQILVELSYLQREVGS